MTDKTLAERLDDLEVRYAFQEETIRQLDEVIQDSSAQIERLKNELKSVREQLKETLYRFGWAI